MLPIIMHVDARKSDRCPTGTSTVLLPAVPKSNLEETNLVNQEPNDSPNSDVERPPSTSPSSSTVDKESSPELTSLEDKEETGTSTSSSTITTITTTSAPAQMPFNHELIHVTHSRMAKKFEELENETGICLPSSTSQNDKQCEDDLIVQNQKEASVIENSNKSIVSNEEVRRLQEDLCRKNDIVEKLSYIRSQVEAELEDLTASLFEEANKMVQAANLQRERAENNLKDANTRMETLHSEVNGLKNLIIHSTPSTPKHNVSSLHPSKKPVKPSRASSKKRNGMPRISQSTYDFGASEQLDSSSQQHPDSQPDCIETNNNNVSGEMSDYSDPIFYKEFKEWRKNPILDPSRSAFMKRIYDEEIYPVFNFKKRDLTSAILRSIEQNTLTVERIKGEVRDLFPRRCALLDEARPCIYRMRVDEGPWYFICSFTRDRITSVCDLLCYLRYVKNGLVKSEPKEIYWQVMRKRHAIASAKLGFVIT